MLPNLRGVQILHRSCRPALICLLSFWTGNTVSNLIMILPPICGAIQTFRDGLEFRYICSFLGLAGLSVESTNYLALYRWQYLSKLSSCSFWQQPFQLFTLFTGDAANHIAYMWEFPDFQFIVLWGSLCVSHSCWCWFLVLPHDAAIWDAGGL